jgi:hypothetical protein
MQAVLRTTCVPALFVTFWSSCSAPPRDSARAPSTDAARSAGAGAGDAPTGAESGRTRDVVISRGRTTPPTVRPGTERETFLAAVAGVLEVDVRSLDLSAPLAERYNADELEVYEIVQSAEDIWRVQLTPPTMRVGEFDAALKPFTTLRAIIDAAEAAARRDRR